MNIDGKEIAQQIKEKIQRDVILLREKNIYPHLAVVLVGDDPSSHAYVRQKKKVGEEVGIEVSLYVIPHIIPEHTLIDHVRQLNNDRDIHGIIIQRPLPLNIPKEMLDTMVDVHKDVDGFHPVSPYHAPVASAVIRILEWVHLKESSKEFFPWIREKNIVIIGRGETAGKPIASLFQKYDIPHTVVHSSSADKEKICRESDILISCVGKPDIVRHHMVHKDMVLIGVGLHDEHGRLAADYRQEELSTEVKYFTPVPGGVGPVNVACLFENVMTAAKKMTGKY